ncbi:MAG: hypothetical protein H6Q26_502 [Bacteroidetes bacterium]|uniref:CAP domain-containing protein n=1 Tax=unclassified Chitinophaga TaxID=2619133 RepID=UPI0009F84298|nr:MULTISPECIES: CAP domain-containing protein [unclassified Chitinophaga]MBP1650345.1 hypothetical protein [Bacteroidota bacterium]WPV64248.1 CAP domain-containing protein [Chitinophaga sp. LS1]
MTRKLTLLTLFGILSLNLLACTRSITPGDSTRVDENNKDMQQEILYYTNKFRASQGKPPLLLDATCSGQAYKHSKAMATGATAFGHDGFEQRVDNLTTVFGRIPGAAENVAYGNLDAQQVVDGWIKSPGHRKNMLGDFDRIGIGSAHSSRDPRIIFFTQVFIVHKEAPAPKK